MNGACGVAPSPELDNKVFEPTVQFCTFEGEAGQNSPWRSCHSQGPEQLVGRLQALILKVQKCGFLAGGLHALPLEAVCGWETRPPHREGPASREEMQVCFLSKDYQS